MSEAFLPFTDCLYPSPTLGLLELSARPIISLAILSNKLLVPVHIFLVSNRLQHPLQMQLPRLEIWGLPSPIPLMSLFHLQIPTAVFSSLRIPDLQLGNISTKLFAISPAGFC